MPIQVTKNEKVLNNETIKSGSPNLIRPLVPGKFGSVPLLWNEESKRWLGNKNKH